MSRREYECDCGSTIMIPDGNGRRCHRLSYHWKKQCDDPPKPYR